MKGKTYVSSRTLFHLVGWRGLPFAAFEKILPRLRSDVYETALVPPSMQGYHVTKKGKAQGVTKMRELLLAGIKNLVRDINLVYNFLKRFHCYCIPFLLCFEVIALLFHPL